MGTLRGTIAAMRIAFEVAVLLAVLGCGSGGSPVVESVPRPNSGSSAQVQNLSPAVGESVSDAEAAGTAESREAVARTFAAAGSDLAAGRIEELLERYTEDGERRIAVQLIWRATKFLARRKSPSAEAERAAFSELLSRNGVNWSLDDEVPKNGSPKAAREAAERLLPVTSTGPAMVATAISRWADATAAGVFQKWLSPDGLGTSLTEITFAKQGAVARGVANGRKIRFRLVQGTWLIAR